MATANAIQWHQGAEVRFHTPGLHALCLQGILDWRGRVAGRLVMLFKTLLLRGAGRITRAARAPLLWLTLRLAICRPACGPASAGVWPPLRCHALQECTCGLLL